MCHEHENRMMFDNFPEAPDELDPDEERELYQTWYDRKEIEAEQSRDDLVDTLEDIGRVFEPGFLTKNQAD